jgi:AraC-like DNA-binding protein
MKPVITVASGHLRMLMQFGARRGLDVDSFMAWLGVDPAILTDPDARFPHERFAVALDEVALRVNAPDLGLELAIAAMQAPHSQLAVLSYVAQSSSTIGAAYHTVIRYLRLVHDGGGIRLDAGGAGAPARVYIKPIVPLPLPRHAHDFMLATMFERGRRLAARSWHPRVVRFEYERPASVAMHEKVFGAPLEFGCPMSEMVFDSEVMEWPVATADPLLHSLMQQQAENLVARLPKLEAPADRVRNSVASLMLHGVPSLAVVARHLGTSVRTLQRTLNQEGITFRQLVDDVRRELGLRHVGEDRMPLPEIAFVLGFSDTSAFHRAFRRWTGTAPGEYRRRRNARAHDERSSHDNTAIY